MSILNTSKVDCASNKPYATLGESYWIEAALFEWAANSQATLLTWLILSWASLSGTALSTVSTESVVFPSQYFTCKELTRSMEEHLSVLSDGVWQRMHLSSGLSSQTEEDRQVSPWLPINKHYSEWVITKQPKKIIQVLAFSPQQGKVKVKRKHLNTRLKGLGYTFLPFVELRLATMLIPSAAYGV